MSDNPAAKDRRSPRVPMGLDVSWIRPDDRVKLRAADVSAEGMFLRTPHIVTPSSILDLEVQWPDGGARFSRLQARVCFSGETRHGFGSGVHLVGVSAQDRARWERAFRSAFAAFSSPIAMPKACVVSVRDAMSPGLRALLSESDDNVLLEVADRGEALDLLSRQPVAVLLCDADAPGNDGLALCRRLRGDKHARQAGVILLVDGDSPTAFITGLRAGADYVVVKPYDDRLLVSRIEHLVQRRFMALEEVVEAASEALAMGPSSLRGPPNSLGPRGAPPSDPPSSAEPRRGSSGWHVSPLRFPGEEPTLLRTAAERASDLWFMTRLYLKDQWKSSR